MSVTIASQVKTYGPRLFCEDGHKFRMRVSIRHDDSCGNGHNSFGITAEIYDAKSGRLDSCGCLHDQIREVFPELAPMIKWHLMSTKEPLHYLANTIFHAKEVDLEAARSAAIWPEATLEQLRDKDALLERLPNLLAEFRSDVEALGMCFYSSEVQ